MKDIKVGDKIRILDYSIFWIDDPESDEYEIIDHDDGMYYFQVTAAIGGTYKQRFNEAEIGRYVEKVEE